MRWRSSARRDRAAATRQATGSPAPGGLGNPMPEVGRNVELRVARTDGPVLQLVTQARELSADELAVAAPAGPLPGALAVGAAIAEGAAVDVVWIGARGLCRAPMVLARVEPASGDSAREPRWWLHARGPVRVEQRRRFVRARTSGRVRLERLDDPAGAPALSGWVTEVSEQAVRVLLVRPAGLVEADSVRLSMLLDDRIYAGTGRVKRSRAGRRSDEIVIELAEPVRDAAALRRHILRRQLLHRSAERDAWDFAVSGRLHPETPASTRLESL